MDWHLYSTFLVFWLFKPHLPIHNNITAAYSVTTCSTSWATGGNLKETVCQSLAFFLASLYVSVTVSKMLLSWVCACSLGAADVVWHIFSHEWHGQGTPQALAVTCLMAMCQQPTTHWLIWILGHPKDVCHYSPEPERADCEQPTKLSISLIDWLLITLWPCPFPGVLCEGHWHLDGSVPFVCVCCPSGVCSS